MLLPKIIPIAMLSSTLTIDPHMYQMVVHKRCEAITQLDVVYARDVPVLDPWTKWIGDTFSGALPVGFSVVKLDDDRSKN